MNGPTGLIFMMRSRLNNQSGDETFFDEVDTAFSGQDAGFDLTGGMTDVAAVWVPQHTNLVQTRCFEPRWYCSSTGHDVGQGMRTSRHREP